MMTSSDMSVFQSIGELDGRDPTRSAALSLLSRGVRVEADSRAIRLAHSASVIFWSQARTLSTLSVGASKRFGYVSFACIHFGVRNSTLRMISIAREGVAPLSSAAASSAGVGDTCFMIDGIV